MTKPLRIRSTADLIRTIHGKVNGRWLWHTRKVKRQHRKEARQAGRIPEGKR